MDNSYKTKNILFIILGISVILFFVVIFSFIMFFKHQKNNVNVKLYEQKVVILILQFLLNLMKIRQYNTKLL